MEGSHRDLGGGIDPVTGMGLRRRSVAVVRGGGNISSGGCQRQADRNREDSGMRARLWRRSERNPWRSFAEDVKILDYGSKIGRGEEAILLGDGEGILLREFFLLAV